LQVSAMRGTRVGGAVISHINITDRKAAENRLKNSEEFNRSVFENSPDCVMVLETDGQINSINSNGLSLLETDSFSSVKGKSWIDFWVEDDDELAYQAVQMAAKGKTAHFEGFSRTMRDTEKWWDVSIAPVFDAEEKVTRLISTSRDITERRQNEREREELLAREQIARKEAEIANRMRDEFLATVSHELRAPLNSILGWGRLMEKGKLDEQTTRKAVQTIVRNAESQNRLIEDLLDVSRIISGKLRLEVITLKPINVVESALETVRPAAEAKGIRLEIKENADVSHIAGDPNRLQQVIWNLLSNAIKFTPNGGEVSVGIERNKDYTEIKVIDSGVGIKEEFLPHVFDRFRQADTSSIRKFGGLGLGLAIVRHITEMHGGTVEVKSSGENKGSTFIVRLPLIASQPEEKETGTNGDAAQKISEPTRKFKLDGLLILVVDDERDTRQLLVQALTFHGATIETAASAEEAMQAIKEKNPDVLVSDIGMPNEDGYSLIRKVRALPEAQHKNMPAIALTAFTRAQDRMRALASGYQNHVAKPVEPDELATVIASLTGRLQIDE
ncbi:MAG: ATP-binding protein, partial [Acidobacteriota bacterium]|nr:ATP-binding protein [Acidobacteriota bacterium]